MKNLAKCKSFPHETNIDAVKAFRDIAVGFDRHIELGTIRRFLLHDQEILLRDSEILTLRDAGFDVVRAPKPKPDPDDEDVWDCLSPAEQSEYDTIRIVAVFNGENRLPYLCVDDRTEYMDESEHIRYAIEKSVEANGWEYGDEFTPRTLYVNRGCYTSNLYAAWG